MALALHALRPIPPVAATLTCHAAVWYWAAQEAQERGGPNVVLKAPQTTLQNIVGMDGGPERAMLALTRSGHWDLDFTETSPPAGTVLLWPGGTTHSAVVVGGNEIRGYNQLVQFPGMTDRGLTTGRANEVGDGYKKVETVAEDTIVAAARDLGL